MKKWIGIVTGSFCILSSSLIADEAPELPEQPVEEAAAPTQLAVEPAAESEELGDVQQQEPKQVGKASVDSTNAAKSSNTTKYVLAAGAVVIGVTAIILVSRHHGRHP
jgi:hypothetical protein